MPDRSSYMDMEELRSPYLLNFLPWPNKGGQLPMLPCWDWKIMNHAGVWWSFHPGDGHDNRSENSSPTTIQKGRAVATHYVEED